MMYMPEKSSNHGNNSIITPLDSIKTVIYARVSTNDQVSTEAQIKELRQEADKNGEDIISVVEEKKTAKDKEGVYDPVSYMKLRPEFYNLYLKAKNKEFNILRVWKWDRFCRSDFQGIIFRMFKDLSVDVVALRDSNDEVVRGIQGVLSKAEINKIKERVELRHQELLQQNRILNRLPLGYKFFKNQPVPDENAEAVKQIFDLASKGVKLKEICNKVFITKKVNGRKLKIRLSLSTCKRVLKNKFYVGIYKFRGQEIKVVYLALINIELFNEVNNIK